MAKALKTAALVVGAVALAATGVGAAVSAGLIAASATTATIATIATVASFAAGVLSIAAGLAAPKGTVGGNATKFKVDKEAGLPYLIGRSVSGGNVIHRQFYGPKNVYESWVTALSLGPVKSIGPLLIDLVATTAIGTAIGGGYQGYMWLDTQLGAQPEARALAGPQGPFPGWNGASKLSGLAADLWTLKFDAKNQVFPEGVPNRTRVLEGVFVYDPRLDDTYPGGVGGCRVGQEATYVYSENPALHAITWAYGRYQNGVLVAGGGLGVDGIDLAPFVEWANVCDAHAWKVGGLIYTTSDNKWDVLKMIAQAGAAEVMPVGALLSVTFSAPRVSIGTITSADISGDLDIPSTSSIRTRRNTIIPRVRLESHGWEIVPLSPVVADDYVQLDRASRPKEIEYPLIQDADQGAQIATYDMLNMRELDGLVIPAKIYALGYRPGDCLTLDIPEADLLERDVIVRQREIAAATLGVTLTCRTEDARKHPYALGQTGTPPPTPDLSTARPDRGAPDATDWTAIGATSTANGVSTASIAVTGAVGNGSADAFVVEYRMASGRIGEEDASGSLLMEGGGAIALEDAADSPWISVGLYDAATTQVAIPAVASGAMYDVAISYRVRSVLGDRLILSRVQAGTNGMSRGWHTLQQQDVAYPVTATSSQITIAAFGATLDDARRIAFPAGQLAAQPGTTYQVVWDLTAGAYRAIVAPALDAAADSNLVAIRNITTASDDGTTPAAAAAPAGDGGSGSGGSTRTARTAIQ